ncbi:hypothetical protein Avbf_08117 [Armadillidium vulgare]|nr:hypothetical protein Avbf_08117 [Armadillidium vulgare]
MKFESKNSYSLRLSMIEEKYSCLANNKLYSPKTQTRKEYEKSEHIKEKLLDYIRLNISSSSKQDYGDQWQDIEEGIKKNQVGNSKKGKSKGVAKYSKLLQNENYNDDHYENDSISVDDIDKWGSSHGSFISKNLSCETRSEGNIRNNVSKTSVVSHCPSETINKMKRKRSRPPKFDKESHCSSKSINKIKRKHCTLRSRPPKFDDVSHRGVKKFKAQLGNSVEVFDSGLGSCDDTRNFHEINKDTQNVIDPKQAKSFNDDDTKIKENISKKKLKCISELGDKNGKHIKESTTENIKKNKRKRACPSKSDVISQEKVNRAKPQLGNSDEIFYIESVR